jgi:hypothetical protein
LYPAFVVNILFFVAIVTRARARFNGKDANEEESKAEDDA